MTYNPTSLLLTGIAQLLADNNVGVYKPNSAYLETDIAIVLKTMPDKPHACIVLNWIPMSSSPTMPHLFGLLQVACRGKPNKPLDCDMLADTCDQYLNGLTQQPFDNCTLNQCTLRNSVNMGQDELKRWTTAVQYNIDLDTPPTFLRPAMGAW